MSEPFIGEIRLFPYSFVPAGWLPCDGRQLALQNYTPLYAVIGTIYGGNGQTYFNLPNLTPSQSFPGLALIGAGAAPGLSSYSQGAVTGVGTVALTAQQMPSHDHTLTAINNTAPNTTSLPSSASKLSRLFAGTSISYAYSKDALPANPATLEPTALTGYGGGGQAHMNMQPYLAFVFAIAYEGIFPSRP